MDTRQTTSQGIIESKTFIGGDQSISSMNIRISEDSWDEDERVGS